MASKIQRPDLCLSGVRSAVKDFRQPLCGSEARTTANQADLRSTNALSSRDPKPEILPTSIHHGVVELIP